jgi:hypothetical protein
MTRSDRIDELVFRMTTGGVSYWWVTNPKAPKPNLERMKQNNPTGYSWLMSYQSLIDEERKENETKNIE